MNKESEKDKGEVSRNAIKPNSQRGAKDKNSVLRSNKQSSGMKNFESIKSSISSIKSSK